MPEDHPDLASRLNNLANSLSDRYDRTGRMDDLEEAIQIARRAVDITPDDHPDLTVWLNNLALMVSDRYDRTGRMDDLEEAIQIARRAVDMTPDDHPDFATWLNTLAGRLYNRSKRTGRMDDHSGLLSNLAKMLTNRHKRTGRMDDLAEAIQVAQRAVDITPEDHPDLASRLNGLAGILSDRYKRTGRMDDLEEVIQISQRAVDITPDDHPGLAGWLNNLAIAVCDRYSRTGRMDDLEEAIRKGWRAVDITPDDHPNLAAILHSLAISLFDRYIRTRRMDHLEEALQTQRRAVDITPEDHPDLASRLGNLADALFRRHYRTGRVDDLEEGIQLARLSIELTPKDHPELANQLDSLAHSLSHQYAQTHEQKDQRASIDTYLNAYRCQNALPLLRIQAARGAISLLVDAGDLYEAHSYAKEALHLLPLVCGRSLSRKDQQHAVTQTTGLAAEACSLLLKTHGNPADGVDYLEQGRGIVIGYLIDGRGDISELEDKHPDIAKEFGRLRTKASTPVRREGSPEIRRQLLQERDAAVRDLEQCLEHIRTQLPGFDRFLLSPALDDLMQYASDGPIVIVNVTSISSDAILIRPSGIEHVPLPAFHASEVEQYRPWGLTRGASRFIEAEGMGIQEQRTEFRQFLHRLWLDCVHPILETLDFLQRECHAALPRIWWIGTGLATALPFHAAGVHSQGATEHAFKYVLSSYTPSIKTLRYARDRAAARSPTQSILLVTMPDTPGAAPLRGVTEEAKAIQRSIGAPHAVHPLPRPSAEAVLRALPDCSIAHFACHGSSDMTDPSSSYLALQGQSASVADPLTVQMISEACLGRAWLAYLSACSTAENQVADLADEALHLASGFQVAGFGHTVASMWPSDDDVCARVASTFYRELLVNGWVLEGNRGVAVALHAAVGQIRETYPTQPSLWAQYIHLGA